MQWEYETEIGEFEEANDFIAKLDELGRKGWEAVSMTADRSGDHYTVLLKREKKAESREAGGGV